MPSVRPVKIFRSSPFALLYWGLLFTLVGFAIYIGGVLFSIVRLTLQLGGEARALNEQIVWLSGAPTTVGLVLAVLEFALGLPGRRRARKGPRLDVPVATVTVALTAYNDESSIGDAVRDFRSHGRVARVLVVSNNSTDATVARAEEAGAIVHNEPRQGYGWCVHRCLLEAAQFDDTSHVVLCEGDMTFRAVDIDKLSAFMPHAAIVNGTRIVEQLRDPGTQLSNFMFYGNFVGGKLLEAKHFGMGTFTDLGTTYKMTDRQTILALLPYLIPSINLEFNAHFLDVALSRALAIVECPVTFHPRIGVSKGGNVNNIRAVRVGLGMLAGLSFGWRARR